MDKTKLPTIEQLMQGGVWAVLEAYGLEDLSVDKVSRWRKLVPGVELAAYKDAVVHRAWGKAHGSMDDCELVHTNLFKAIGKYI